MAVVDIEKAVELAIDEVCKAHAKNKLQQLTNRIVRQETEKSLELETGTLEEQPYKKRINEAIAATVEKLEIEDGIDSAGGKKKKERRGSVAKPSSSAKKRKSVDAGATEVKKKPRPSTAANSHLLDEDRDVQDIPSPKSASTGKKRKGENSVEIKASKKDKPKSVVVGKAPASGEKKVNYKSKEIIVSDEDEENTAKHNPASPVLALSAEKTGKRPIISDTEDETKPSTPPKRRRKSEGTPSKIRKKSDSIVAKESGVDAKTPGESKKDVAAYDIELKSDSELSVLLDDPLIKRTKEPKKTKKSKGDAKDKTSRVKKEAKELSPDDEQIKKLKSFVVACGVRKIWSKELKDCDTPPSQISHLRKILTDLGMKGRFSLEQAKAIKAKRDLAKEMEDVQEFAQRYAGDRPKRSAVKAKPAAVDASSDGESDVEAETSTRSKNAHRSIMDFLGDQSGSD